MKKKLITLVCTLLGCTFGYSAYAMTYQVKTGDTLNSISLRIFGSTDFAELIYRENKAKIPNQKRLTPGTTLSIPAEKPPAELEQHKSKIRQTEEGLPLLLDMGNTEPPDPWCCCVDNTEGTSASAASPD